jgi:tetraacyldisaccharide 4'-kinase
MDDGFQHRRLHRDLNVVCLDASRPTGHPAARQARTLPLGLFREGYAALRRADWAVLTRWDQATPHDQRRMEALLQHYQVPYGACLHRLQSAQALTAQDGTAATADVVVRALTDFTEPVLALAAIAVPAAFQQSLIDAGVEVAELLAFPDHYHFQPADIERIVTLAAGRPILCTAKDAVKLQHVWPQDAAAQIWQVPVQLAWEGDAEQRFGAQVARLLPSP